jgi:7,8-dihydropterin-6-yl-methyl-4-(beta-D-ribofuranosyl)aminobenzene 5'-phosphate synthase
MDQISQIQFSVVFNNMPYDPNCRIGWGFSCFIQGPEKHILFDTGSNGDILLYNMKTMHLRAEDIDRIVLSHAHFDHTGGLASVLEVNPRVTICAPQDTAVSLRRQLSPPTKVLDAADPIKLCDQVMTTGSMGRGLQEQALMIDLPPGLVIITGCAHPGVTNIVRRAKEISSRPVHLLIGGFHLMGHSRKQVAEIADELMDVGVQYIAPSHCTGGIAVEYFKQRWGEHFVHSGCGARIVLAEQTTKAKE